MPSRSKFPFQEEEVKVDQTIEEKEEVEAKTEEEETGLQMKMEGAAIKIRTKTKAVANKVEKIKHMDKGMINPQVHCHYCKKYGHYANECRKK